MSPRYGRKNRRYRVRPVARKMSRERKVAVQSACSFVLLLLMICMSFLDFVPSRKISACLYEVYSVSRWKGFFAPTAKKAEAISRKAVAAYMDLFGSLGESGKETISDTPSAKADSGDAPERAEYRPRQKEPSPEEAVQAPAPEEKWIMPHLGQITSPYGERVHPINGQTSIHTGIDIAAEHGDAVWAVHSGTVEKVGYDDINGNYVILSHGEGITSVYIHLSGVTVDSGQSVAPGGEIGKVGSTGTSTGPHLHFEIKENGVSVDPGKYISGGE